MKPAWDQLGSDYESSASVIVGDVDCTEHKELCNEHDVKGFPTIKYLKDGNWEAYQGGRDAEQLTSFVKETLEVLCQVADPTGCSEKEVKFLEKMQAAGNDEVAKQVTRLDGMAASSMKPELMQWLNQRRNILKQLSSK